MGMTWTMRLQERARAIIERRPDLEHRFDG
jgi:hypothetical protein